MVNIMPINPNRRLEWTIKSTTFTHDIATKCRLLFNFLIFKTDDQPQKDLTKSLVTRQIKK
jgi:hypothetical protein